MDIRVSYWYTTRNLLFYKDLSNVSGKVLRLKSNRKG